MTALLSIRNLTVTYRRDGSEVTALKSVSLDIPAGERFAIIGESGSGKSTLALAIAGLLPGSARIEGRIDWLLRPPPMSGAKTPPSVGAGQWGGGVGGGGGGDAGQHYGPRKKWEVLKKA
ncbi:ATP-binding cassette domain-containing protein, partial [Mesorhizobium sp. M0894]|uniref:ATP-binding cassette domain-containing protein n=1 Tax=Mesorhizobium sp. M0894 TaxID=2957018 RepID=UPI00333C7075